jgi:hypothetical protein
MFPLLICVQGGVWYLFAVSEFATSASHLIVVVTHRGNLIAGINVQIVFEKSVDPVFGGTTDEKGGWPQRVLVESF